MKILRRWFRWRFRRRAAAPLPSGCAPEARPPPSRSPSRRCRSKWRSTPTAPCCAAKACVPAPHATINLLDKMGNVIILGSQWGDEGKGKIVDLFSDRFDIVARYQGGHNAGHTVFIGDRKYVLKLIPSGILRPGKKAVIGNGLVIDPAALLAEIETLEAAGVAVEGNLFISNRAHVLFPV